MELTMTMVLNLRDLKFHLWFKQEQNLHLFKLSVHAFQHGPAFFEHQVGALRIGIGRVDKMFINHLINCIAAAIFPTV